MWPRRGQMSTIILTNVVSQGIVRTVRQESDICRKNPGANRTYQDKSRGHLVHLGWRGTYRTVWPHQRLRAWPHRAPVSETRKKGQTSWFDPFFRFCPIYQIGSISATLDSLSILTHLRQSSTSALLSQRNHPSALRSKQHSHTFTPFVPCCPK